MRQNAPTRCSGGFTLIEILVALILIALILGAVVPSVLQQVVKGDTNRVIEDLDAVSRAAQTFRMDVNRWPGDLEDLVVEPTAASSTVDADLDGNAYSAGMVNRWKGPYLEGVTLVGDTGIATADDGQISGTIFDAADDTTFALNGEGYLTFRVLGLSQGVIDAVDVAVDGAEGAEAGRVRTTSSTLHFLGRAKK